MPPATTPLKSFEIRNLALGAPPGISISDKDFHAAADGKERLLKTLFVEEAYDVFVQNYADLENTILNVIVDDMVDRHDGRIAIETARRRTDRAIANLLSSGRLASDLLERTTIALFGRRSTQVADLTHLMKQQADLLVGFRAMIALRNYVQHYGLPIQSVTFGHEWVNRDDEDRRRLQQRFTVSFSPNSLLADRKVPAELIEDLRALANNKGRVSLLPLIREYVDGMSNVHVGMREKIAEFDIGWRTAISALVDRFSQQYGPNNYPGLSAVSLDAQGGILSDIPLKIQLEERIEYLRKLNGRLLNLKRREIVS